MHNGRLFEVDGKKIFGLYSKNKGVVYAEPPGMRHVAHVEWGTFSSSRRSNIDYFAVADGGKAKFEAEEVRSIGIGDVDMSREVRYRVSYKILSGFRGFEKLVRAVAVEDIRAFLARKREEGNLFSKERGKSDLRAENARVEYVDFIPGAEIRIGNRARVSLMGKQDFYPECAIDLNLDFANWCISGVTKDMKLAPWNCCNYCYSAYTHKNFPDVFSAVRGDIGAQIQECRARRAEDGKPTRYLRFGKRTEAGAKFFREQLINSLEACIDCGIKAIFPTKFLEYDSDVAELLRRSDSTLLISLGRDEFEPGAVAWGRTNAARVEDGRRYLKAGVRVVPYVLVNVPDPFLWDKFPEEDFKRKIERLSGIFGRVQFIPVRIRYSGLGEMIGGWESCLASESGHLFAEDSGGYFKGGDGTRLPCRIHRFIGNLVGENNGNVRMCSHGKQLHCGKCFIPCERGIVLDDWKYIPAPLEIQRKKSRV